MVSVVAEVPVVLFMCTHNAGRSQMAAALLAREASGCGCCRLALRLLAN